MIQFFFILYIFLKDYQSFSYVFKIYPKWSWITDIEYDPSGNSKYSYHVGADILNLSF